MHPKRIMRTSIFCCGRLTCYLDWNSNAQRKCTMARGMESQLQPHQQHLLHQPRPQHPTCESPPTRSENHGPPRLNRHSPAHEEKDVVPISTTSRARGTQLHIHHRVLEEPPDLVCGNIERAHWRSQPATLPSF